MTEAEYRQQAGILDERCDECQMEHGSFVELKQESKQRLNLTDAQADIFISENRKRKDFDKALSAEIARRKRDASKNEL